MAKNKIRVIASHLVNTTTISENYRQLVDHQNTNNTSRHQHHNQHHHQHHHQQQHYHLTQQQQLSSINEIITDEDNLEEALKKFIQVWDRTHGLTHDSSGSDGDSSHHHHLQTSSSTSGSAASLSNSNHNNSLKDINTFNNNNNTTSMSYLLSGYQSDAASPSASSSSSSSSAADSLLTADHQQDFQTLIAQTLAKQLTNKKKKNKKKQQTTKNNGNDDDVVVDDDDDDDHDDEDDDDLAYDEQSLSGVNCTRCVLHEEAKTRRLETIKVNILNKLGLKSAPNITGKPLPRIPPLHHLLDRYNMLGDDPRLLTGQQLFNGFNIDDNDQTIDKDGDNDGIGGGGDDDYEEFFVNAERSISFAQKPPGHLNIPPEVKCQYFRFSANVLNAHVSKAHLWVFVRPTNHQLQVDQQLSTTAWIVVYQIVRQENGNDSPTLLHVRAKKIDVNSKKGVWVQIELKKLVSQWFRHPGDNLGLAIHSYDKDGKELAVIEANSNEDNSLMPFIEVRVESKAANRRRRMAGLNCEENSHEVRCCRYPLTVDFEEFGWDWIIAPKRYEANYCSGECPYVFLQKYPHTHLVQQANPSGSAGPCCSPRKMSAISMLYFDDNYNIIYGMLPGMVVDRCGCS
ncbi:growth/differentiation factor 8-like [Oppia nitens]|uniref:growth/differentiation factor 8-like n=1 Tax=Oppia nitens TaxID=1686743 RepID=UPI0023DCC652|nr:growth/differentiation factor 8-like [Oppia nitens]